MWWVRIAVGLVVAPVGGGPLLAAAPPTGLEAAVAVEHAIVAAIDRCGPSVVAIARLPKADEFSAAEPAAAGTINSVIATSAFRLAAPRAAPGIVRAVIRASTTTGAHPTEPRRAAPATAANAMCAVKTNACRRTRPFSAVPPVAR